MDIDQLESELVHLKGMHCLNNARIRAIEKVSTAPIDLDGISKLVTELTIKCEIQAEVISFQKDRIIKLQLNGNN